MLALLALLDDFVDCSGKMEMASTNGKSMTVQRDRGPKQRQTTLTTNHPSTLYNGPNPHILMIEPPFTSIIHRYEY